jgi:hypothetical protein
MANDSEKPTTFDSLPAWMTWVDIVQEYGDPNCRCSLCVALRTWILDSAGRTETQLNELEDLAAKLKAHRSDTTPEEWTQLNHDLLRSALAAGVKLRKLVSLRGWAVKNASQG